MGDEDYRAPLVVELMEYLHDLLAGVRVEVAGRFVREDYRRARGDCTGYRDSLLLTAGHLRGQVVHALFEPDSAQCVDRELLALLFLYASVYQRQLNVSLCREARNKIKALEDEADLPVADAGERRRLHVAHRLKHPCRQ